MKMNSMELEYASDEHAGSSEEDEEDEGKHEHLLDAILSLDGKKKQKVTQRTVPSTEVSEFNFKKSGDAGKVKLHELVGSLRETVQHGTLKQQLKTLKQKNQVADAPLSRPEKERIQRTVTYDKTKQEVSKWEPIIKENRKAEQLQFPLERPELSLTADNFVKRFQPRTPLEMEIATALQGSESRQTHETILTRSEEKALLAMDVQEAIERRAELQKYRALMSYQEAKAKRQKKIKSKRYHKFLRKDKLKAEAKSIAELRTTDPEAYLEKLRQLDRDRMQERMSLKHKTGGKFARRQKIFAKFSIESRQAVQDMFQKNKELTEKLNVESESDDEHGSGEENGSNTNVSSSRNNPWMSAPSVLKSTNFSRPEKLENTEALLESDNSENEDVMCDSTSREINKSLTGKHKLDEADDDHSRRRKVNKHMSNDNKNQSVTNFVEGIAKKNVTVKKTNKRSEKRKAKKMKKKSGNTQKDRACKVQDDPPKTVSSLEENNGQNKSLIVESLKRKQTLNEINNGSSSSDNDDNDDKEKVDTRKKSEDQTRPADSNNKMDAPSLDPRKIFTVETDLSNTMAPDMEEDDGESSANRRITIAQAFADDDVLDEFSKEKKEIVDREKPKDIDLTLPGWGEWGGTGLRPSKRKRKRFVLKAPPGPPRQDRLLGHVVISEQKDKNITKYQVNQLPFPFTSADQFEKSIRAPIGKTWNPETAFKQLTKPKVVTRLGTVIKPMDKETAFKNYQKNKEEKESKGGSEEKQNTRAKDRKTRMKMQNKSRKPIKRKK